MLDGCLSPALPRPVADDGRPLLLEELVDRAEGLAPAGATVNRLLSALDEPDASAQSVARLLEEDPVLSARILRATAASARVVREPIEDMRDAVGRLGLGGVKQVALTLAVSRPRPIEAVVMDGLRSHLLAAAACARVVAGYVEDAPLRTASLCGLLVGVGRLVFARAAPLHYGELCELAAVQGASITSLEEDWAGFSHVELGGAFARRWQLPGVVQHAIDAAHRLPRDGADPRWALAAACAGLGAEVAAVVVGEAPLDRASVDALSTHPSQALLRLSPGVLSGLHRECERARFDAAVPVGSSPGVSSPPCRP